MLNIRENHLVNRKRLHRKKRTLFFAPVFGTNDVNLTASATACVKPSTCGVIVGVESVEFTGGSSSDSYNSEHGPYSSSEARDNGHVCSDGPIKVGGGGVISGNALPGEGFEVEISGGSTVTGSTEPRSTTIPVPPINFGDSATNNNNDDIPLTHGGDEPINAKGELVVSGGDILDLPPGVYHFPQVVGGGSLIQISGPTVMYVTGKYDSGGGSFVNDSFLPSNFRKRTATVAVRIKGDRVATIRFWLHDRLISTELLRAALRS